MSTFIYKSYMDGRYMMAYYNDLTYQKDMTRDG